MSPGPGPSAGRDDEAIPDGGVSRGGTESPRSGRANDATHWERLVDWATVDRAAAPHDSGLLRAAALACLGTLTLAYVSTLHYVVSVVGGVDLFLAVAGGAVLLGVLLGATLRPRAAILLSAALLVGGLALYLVALPETYRTAITPANVLRDTVALLTGYSVLQLVAAGMWATAVVPAPTFLAWYFGIRGEYTRAAATAGLTLGFFVLTGDAGVVVTLSGVLAASGVVALGTLARLDAGREQVEVVAVAFALMILASAAVSAVPGGGASPMRLDSTSVQPDLVTAEDTVGVGGSLQLSPAVHFVVTADEGEYWRTGAYDRFTGSSWVQTGTGTAPVEGELDRPEGPRTELTHTVEARTDLHVLPAAAEPYRVGGVDARVDQLGGLEPENSLSPGEQYAVTSLVSDADEVALYDADTDYPESITETYLQTPGSTSDRTRELTANITRTADTPYTTALAVEQYLESQKEYSLDVPAPEGNIAEQFLFEMEAGYCVYYATTMVTMLRTQGVPARYVSGYTPGQRVSEDEWVVRGYDAHAWVEVYFPEVGWVKFDPTPSESREAAEQDALESARSSGEENVDTAGSQSTYQPTTTATTTTPELTEITVGNSTSSGGGNATVSPPYRPTTVTTPGQFDPGDWNVSTTQSDEEAVPEGGSPFRVPPVETLALWSVLVVGLAVGLRRSGATARAYRAIWLRVPPRDADPATVVEGAFDRAAYVLARRERERRDGETVREYLDAVGASDEVRRLAALHERARHAGRVTPEDAEEARTLAAGIVRRGPSGDSV